MRMFLLITQVALLAACGGDRSTVPLSPTHPTPPAAWPPTVAGTPRSMLAITNAAFPRVLDEYFPHFRDEYWQCVITLRETTGLGPAMVESVVTTFDSGEEVKTPFRKPQVIGPSSATTLSCGQTDVAPRFARFVVTFRDDEQRQGRLAQTW